MLLLLFCMIQLMQWKVTLKVKQIKTALKNYLYYTYILNATQIKNVKISGPEKWVDMFGCKWIVQWLN